MMHVRLFFCLLLLSSYKTLLCMENPSPKREINVNKAQPSAAVGGIYVPKEVLALTTSATAILGGYHYITKDMGPCEKEGTNKLLMCGCGCYLAMYCCCYLVCAACNECAGTTETTPSTPRATPIAQAPIHPIMTRDNDRPSVSRSTQTTLAYVMSNPALNLRLRHSTLRRRHSR